MNYRHAFHAGNAMDVFKHSILTRIISYIYRKQNAVRIIDTHAGIGLYDLESNKSQRTGEWKDGIGRLTTPLEGEAQALMEDYLSVIRQVKNRFGNSFYPGSPQIIREMLRPQDKAILIERHPDDAKTLKTRYQSAHNIKVLAQDGWQALHALIPPPEKRGLVLIDPPFEEDNEHVKLGHELAKAVLKWQIGLYAGWYPIKTLKPADKLAAILKEKTDCPILRIEMLIDRLDDPARLNGCGLIVINPPWVLEDEMKTLLPSLSRRLSRSGYSDWRCEKI